MLHADHSLVDEDYAGAFAALSGEGGSPDGDDGPLDDRDRLCLLLMIERSRGRRSEWAPYLASLPAAYDDPLWWDAGARLLLRGSRAGAAADAAERALGRLSRLRARLVEARARELEREEAAGEGSGRESASEHRRVRNRSRRSRAPRPSATRAGPAAPSGAAPSTSLPPDRRG